MLSYFSDNPLLLHNCTGRVTGLSAVLNGLTGLNSSGTCIKQMYHCRKYSYSPEKRVTKNSKGGKEASKRGGGGGGEWGGCQF